MKGRALLVLMAVVFLGGSLANAAVLAFPVDRTGGATDNRLPIGAYDGDTDPLGPSLLADGEYAFSDREYPWFGTPTFMVGTEYVQTFNSDKGSATMNYAVTLNEAATIYIGIDDRHGDHQTKVDGIAAFAAGGTFQLVDGHKLTIRERADGSRDRPFSLYAADLAAGTYDFGHQASGSNNNYALGVLPPVPVPPPPTHMPIAFNWSTTTNSGTISGILNTKAAGGPDDAVLFTGVMPAPTVYDPNPSMTPAGSIGTITQPTGDHNPADGNSAGLTWEGQGPVTLTGTDSHGTVWTVDVPLTFGPSGDPGYNNPGEDPLSSYDPEEGPDYVYQWTIEISDDALAEHGGDANSPGGSDNPRMAVFLGVGEERANGLAHRFTQIEREFAVGPDAYTNDDGTTGSTKWTKFAAYQPLSIYYAWRDRHGIGGGSFQVDSIEFSGNLRVPVVTMTPEPATLVLLGIGGGLALLRRRRK